MELQKRWHSKSPNQSHAKLQKTIKDIDILSYNKDLRTQACMQPNEMTAYVRLIFFVLPQSLLAYRFRLAKKRNANITSPVVGCRWNSLQDTPISSPFGKIMGTSQTSTKKDNNCFSILLSRSEGYKDENWTYVQKMENKKLDIRYKKSQDMTKTPLLYSVTENVVKLHQGGNAVKPGTKEPNMLLTHWCLH